MSFEWSECLKVVLPEGKAEDEAASAACPRLPKAKERSGLHGCRWVRYLPVSLVARDWNVSSRRIRALLVESRLEGIRRANGYWEVAYPYRFTFGSRGPGLKRSQKAKKAERRPE